MLKSLHRLGDGYRWCVLGMGVLAQAVFAVAFAGIPVAGVLMRESYRFSAEDLGFVLGCMGFGVAISEIVWGVVTDRLGDKIVLCMGLGGMSATFAAAAAFFAPSGAHQPSPFAVGGLLVLAGAIGGSINSSSGRAVMGWFAERERGLAMSIRQTAIPAGGVAGSILVPFIARVQGFQLAYALLAGLYCIVALIVLLGMTEKPLPIKSASEKSAASPLGRPAVWRIALASGFLTVSQMAVLTFGGIYLADARGLSLPTIVSVLVLIQSGGALLRIAAGFFTDRRRNRPQVLRMIAWVAGAAAIVLAVVAYGDAVSVMASFILLGLAGHAWHGVAYAEAAATAGIERVGTALGMVGMIVFLVSFLTPYAIPRLLAISSWSGVWASVGLLSWAAVLFAPRRTATS